MPAQLREIEKAGEGTHDSAAQGHKPPLLIDGHIIKGKGHRIDKDSGGDIPQAADQPQSGEITQTGSHQSGKSAQSRPGGRHKAQSKGGICIKHPGGGEHYPKKQPPGTLRQNRNRRLTGQYLPARFQSLPQGVVYIVSPFHRFHCVSPHL